MDEPKSSESEKEMAESESGGPAEWLTTIACWGCVAAGIGGLYGALIGFTNTTSSSTQLGTSLIASGLAFGLLANAILRK